MTSFIETRIFSQLVQENLTDDEYCELQAFLIEEPDAGVVIPKSGGVRKLRWGAPGMGKRGGFRVIYFVKAAEQVIWTLTIYRKNVKDDIPAKVLKKIRDEMRASVESYTKGDIVELPMPAWVGAGVKG